MWIGSTCTTAREFPGVCGRGRDGASQAWWTTFGGGYDVAIVGTKSGTVTFWEVPTGVLVRVLTLPAPIDALDIAIEDGDSAQTLFVQAGGHHRVVLEEGNSEPPTPVHPGDAAPDGTGECGCM